MKKPTLILICLFFLSACAPKINTQITKTYPTLSYNDEVKVFGLKTVLPANVEVIGSIKIGDTGFTLNCNYETVLENAKIEARKIGGNAIKITEHLFPNIFGSSCHRIKADILKINDFNNLNITQNIDSSLLNADYAVLNFYRLSGQGPLVNYDIHLGDSVICRVRNNTKQSIKVKIFGANILWAKTESRSEIPIQIEKGKTYFIRCDLGVGFMVGNPKLFLVNPEIGQEEFDYITRDANKNDLLTQITLNDGRVLKGYIKNDTDGVIYFTLVKNGTSTETQINKSEIKEIISPK
jgi:hypothetical protein